MKKRVPRRLEGRDRNDGLVQLRRYRWVVVVVVVVLAAFMLTALGRMFTSQTIESGRRELEAMRKDPVLRFRALGTVLVSQRGRPVEKQLFGGGQTESFIEQTFHMVSDPGDTVTAYRHAAQAVGWRLIAEGCSRAEGATGSVFAKTVGEFPATLVVRAGLDRRTDRSPAPHDRPALSVTLWARDAGIDDLPVDAGLHRNELNCLKGVDPSDPDLRPATLPPLSPEDLCGLIPVTSGLSPRAWCARG